MSSRRERAAAEKKRERVTLSAACQAKHPVFGSKCWRGKPCQPGDRHMTVRPKAGGGVEKFYWPVNTPEEK